MSPDPNELLASRGRDEESVFARDENDALVRREKATRAMFERTALVVIDGYPVTVPQAVPVTDAQGNSLRADDGGLVPRNSTIYDAALQLVHDQVWSPGDLNERIPVLCHQPHLAPVGMCRMCVVQIQQIKRGQPRTERKLLPACQHMVADRMVVTTRQGDTGYNPEVPASFREEERHAWESRREEAQSFARAIRASTTVLMELLLADHRKPERTAVRRYVNELEAVAEVVGVAEPRERLQRSTALPSRNTPSVSQARRIPLPLASTPVSAERVSRSADQTWKEWNTRIDAELPYSSRTVVVDHDLCILCDRCVRSCAEVKPFAVIGHTGKGYSTRISFDLDSLMGESSCVQCGECMTACPTGALSLRRRVQPRAWDDSPESIPQNPNTPFPEGSGFLTADEMRDIWLAYCSPTRGPRVVFPFQSVPYAYLKWNEGAVRRWEIAPGEERVLCREGEYGSTAFLLRGTGTFAIHARGRQANSDRPGLLGRFFKRKPRAEDFGPLIRIATGDELLLGEMTCLTHRPRTASVIAIAAPDNPSLELEVDENGWPTATTEARTLGPLIVYEITRNMLDMMQRTASARTDIEEMYTFRAVQACVYAGQMFAGLTSSRRDEVMRFLLDSDRLQFRRLDANQTVVAEGDAAGSFYIVRLGTLRVYRDIAGRDEVLRVLSAGDYFGEAALLSSGPTRRAASVATLDRVELVAIPVDVFLEMCQRFPEVRDRFRQEFSRTTAEAPTAGLLGEYVRQGLFQGQKLLTLDLTSCTRCDECTRACADSHDGHSRLLRDGLRFGDFLVATSCRSCHTPYCMEGCPVDAIHRVGTHLEVIIENHCIGCGLCERNCPYGAIQMVERDAPNPAARGFPDGNPNRTAAPRRAVNCDLCNGSEPFCVQACPHDSAHRHDGPTLLGLVKARTQK